jgi:phytoene dehydrogenase-like protein
MPSSTYMYDVAVVGGGAAGTAAAVGAAQAGARTALFESFGCLGGAATMKSVTTYCGLYYERGRVSVGYSHDFFPASGLLSDSLLKAWRYIKGEALDLA